MNSRMIMKPNLLLFSIFCALTFPTALFFTFSDAPNSQSSQLIPHHAYPHQHRPSGRSLLSLTPKPTTALVATLDGTMYLVEIQESGDLRAIWSFSTGSPIYHSYHASINKNNGKENTSAALVSGYVECGNDWTLYMHDKHFGKMIIPESIAEYVARTPTFADDGAVTLGSKKSTLFEVDAKTGRIIHIHFMSDFNNASAPWSDDQQGTNISSAKSKDLANPSMLSSPQLLLKIFRTDYSLQSFCPSTGRVLWTTTVAEFDAVLLCQRFPIDAVDEYAYDTDLNFTMPYPCQEIQQVFRLQMNYLFEPSTPERLPGIYNGNDSNDNADVHPHPPLEITKQSIQQQQQQHCLNAYRLLHKRGKGGSDVRSLTSLTTERLFPIDHEVVTIGVNTKRSILSVIYFFIRPIPLFMIFLLILLCHRLMVKKQVKLDNQNCESELKSTPAKKKRARRSGKNNGTVDKKEKHLPSEDDDVLTQKDADQEAWLNFNQVVGGADGRWIGKLFVSNKEIAKGSNGTIIFEGIYEGREVAVKRLVKAHHDVASKEIQNLIVSDHHPNIVRWHGVEYDQDFVYLALERCTCSLDDLIQIYSEDQDFRCLVKVKMETRKDDTQHLWKINGYPSPLLLKLMREVVSGVVHLHELGIIHRDLKPQNVLIIKERSLSAKLSDMGISKRLLEDMSSLGHNATGCGSSGWQAPEQLVHGRQTRAVDLYSLGCVLFYCITGGRHPFGERLERDVNILKNQKDLFLVEFIPEAEDLISRLLNPDPDLRPKAIEVLHHPFFWSSEMRVSFFRDASDRVELEDREASSDLLKALESIARVALGAKWNEKMEPAFISNIGHYRRYKFDSVRDLLRVMRNKLNHYRELPQEIQELVGPVPEGFNEYFASRFPRLLIEVYKVIYKYCKEEECFQRYFKNVD